MRRNTNRHGLAGNVVIALVAAAALSLASCGDDDFDFDDDDPDLFNVAFADGAFVAVGSEYSIANSFE